MSTDLAAESDFFAMAPAGVAVHITQLKTDDASRLQPDSKPDADAIFLSCGGIRALAAGSPLRREPSRGLCAGWQDVT